jgi:hypothetical protein
MTATRKFESGFSTENGLANSRFHMLLFGINRLRSDELPHCWAKESPGTRAAANARSTTLPVIFAVNTWLSARKLTPSIMPVTAAIPSNA